MKRKLIDELFRHDIQEARAANEAWCQQRL